MMKCVIFSLLVAMCLADDAAQVHPGPYGDQYQAHGGPGAYYPGYFPYYHGAHAGAHAGAHGAHGVHGAHGAHGFPYNYKGFPYDGSSDGFPYNYKGFPYNYKYEGENAHPVQAQATYDVPQAVHHPAPHHPAPHHPAPAPAHAPAYEPTPKLAYVGKFKGTCKGAADGLYYVDDRSFAYCSNNYKTIQSCADGSANPPYEDFNAGKYHHIYDFCTVNLVDFKQKY